MGKRNQGPAIRAVPAVTRAVAILRLLGQSSSPLPLKTISQELGLVPSTSLHILRVLAAEGLVRQDASKRYCLDVGLLALARSVIETNPFAALVQPVLDRLAAEWDATMIGVAIGNTDHIVAVALARPQSPFRLHVDVGSRFPSLISATGRLVAAYGDVPEDELAARILALRWDRPPDITTWKKEVQLVRRKGYSIDRGNYISGVTIIAVPIFDAQQKLTHALVCASMADKLAGDRSIEVATRLQDEAQVLSRLLTSGH